MRSNTRHQLQSKMSVLYGVRSRKLNIKSEIFCGAGVYKDSLEQPKNIENTKEYRTQRIVSILGSLKVT